tara:strand:+ start:456 stop:707 length:252 start_codon:yes stop_codon:yes gene_type:complete
MRNKIGMSDVIPRIEKALDEVRPFLANDGGDVSVVAVEGTTVKVQFHGACVGCKVSDFTLKGGIETIIKKYVPEIEKVVSINE